MKNIILGTAQFDSSYSLVSKNNSIKEKLKILSLAWEMGIRYLDCAPVYKNAEKTIGRWHLDNPKKKFKVLGKIQNYKNNKLLINYTKNQIKKSLFNLNINSYYCISMHNYDQNFNYELFKYIFENKVNLKLQNIGVTIYSENDLFDKNILKKIKIIQLPFNLVDNKIFKLSDYKNVKIHGRSIFLKGILINKIKFKNKSLLNKLHKNIDVCVKKLSRDSKIDLCINYVRSFNEIDKLVIGVDNCDHLIEINRVIKNKKLNDNEIKIVNNQFKMFKNSINDPRKW